VTDILADLRDALDRLREARRVVFCHPDHEAAIRSAVDAAGCGGFWSIEVIPTLSRDELWIFDPSAARYAELGRERPDRAAREVG
jgi:hypothetical protein